MLDVTESVPAVVESVTRTESAPAKPETAPAPTPTLVVVPLLTPTVDGNVSETPVTEKELDVTDVIPSALNVNVPVTPGGPRMARLVNVASPLASVVAVAFDSVALPDVAVNAAVTVIPDAETDAPLASTIWTVGTVDHPVRTP